MRTTEESLLEGAFEAAQTCKNTLGHLAAEFTLVVSCVGRKLVLQQRAHEELQQVENMLQTTNLAGFYSYGEIAPADRVTRCELQNQTITLTSFAEF